MRLVLGDQPFLGAPGSAGAPACDPLDTAVAANILGLECHERLPWLYFDVKESAPPRRWFRAASRRRFCTRLGLCGLGACLCSGL
jgi:hypothetical protein